MRVLPRRTRKQRGINKIAMMEPNQEKDFSCRSCVINGSNPRQIITDCYIRLYIYKLLSKSQTWRMRNTKLQKEKAAGTTFSTTWLQMYFVQAIEWQQSDCQFRNSGSTWFACIKHVHITVHHITTWSLRLLNMFMSSQVRILKPSGVDPHRLCRPLSHIG